MKTPNASVAEINASKKWYVLDVDGQVLGRVATKVASILRGKHKPIFAPHYDAGDFVIIINAERIRLTGKKADEKTYFHYTGYPGGGRFESFKELIKDKPERILEHAIKGMLPKNRLGRKMLSKVKIYSGPEHPHRGQEPEVITM